MVRGAMRMPPMRCRGQCGSNERHDAHRGSDRDQTPSKDRELLQTPTLYEYSRSARTGSVGRSHTLRQRRSSDKASRLIAEAAGKGAHCMPKRTVELLLVPERSHRIES